MLKKRNDKAKHVDLEIEGVSNDIELERVGTDIVYLVDPKLEIVHIF